MTNWRAFLRRHRGFAAVIVAAALCVRMLVPAGFMPSVADGRITVAVCSGHGSTTMTVAIPGLAKAGAADDAEAKRPCAFADLSLPALGGADPIQLAAALAYVLATGLALVAAFRVRRVARLLPPLRGPPALLRPFA